MPVSCATAIGILELTSYRFRYRQDEMGHQFGLYGHLCLRLSHGVLERVGLRDVVWGTNDPWIGGNTKAHPLVLYRIEAGKHSHVLSLQWIAMRAILVLRAWWMVGY